MAVRGFNEGPPSKYGFMNPEILHDPIQIRKYIQRKELSIPYHCDVKRVKACALTTQDFIRGGYSLEEMVAFGFTWNDLVEMGLSKMDFYDGWFDTKTIAQRLCPTPSLHEALRKTLEINASDLVALYSGGEDFLNLGITMETLILYFCLTFDQFLSLEMSLEELHRYLAFSAKDIKMLGLNHYQMSALYFTHDWTPENLRIHCNFTERDRALLAECEQLRTTIENIEL